MKQESLSSLLDEIARQRNIGPEVLVNAIQTGIMIAAQRKSGMDNLRALFNTENGTFTLRQIKTVKEEVTDSNREISLSEAQELNPASITGETVSLPFDFSDLGRLAARTTRRMMEKTLEEIETDHRYAQIYADLWKLAIATVRGKGEEGEIFCDVAEKPAELPLSEQAFREEFKNGEVIKVVIVAVERRKREIVPILSRTHPLLLRYLLIREVPEINAGHLEIKSLARDTAGRAKVAVHSTSPNIDAVGACIGPKGARVRRIINELKGENIDIIEWSENPEKFIAAALTPAKVISVKCNPKNLEADVTLKPDQHSIAVGKKGLNIRLASRVTRWKINLYEKQ